MGGVRGVRGGGGARKKGQHFKKTPSQRDSKLAALGY